jgi:cystathionine beta-lyase
MKLIRKNQRWLVNDQTFFSLFMTFSLIELANIGSGIIDGLIVSRFFDSNALAAVGLANPMFSICGIVSGLLATGIIFCNPHNPTGSFWNKSELEKVGEICSRNGITVISDEIHCDITEPSLKYIPFASVNDVNKSISITCIAPSKTFNIAGVSSAGVSIPNKLLRDKVGKALTASEIAEPNAFAVQAAIAAYEFGEPWLEELRDYIFANKKYIRDFITDNIPALKDVSGPCTYLSWIDARGLGDDSIGFAKKLRQETGLWIIDGKAYGKAGEGYLRINAASPRTLIEDGMNRLKKGVEGL